MSIYLTSFSFFITLSLGDKEEMKRKREEALERAQKRAEEESTKKAEDKRANEKFTLKEIMKVCCACISNIMYQSCSKYC